MPQHQPGQHPQNVPRALLTGHLDRQALAGELVDHRQELQGPAFAGPLEHEVVRPNVVAIRRSEPDTGPVIEPQPTALGMSDGHLQPLPSPDPLHSLVIHSPAISRQQGRDPPVAIPPVFAGQRDDVGGQNRLVVCHPGRVSLGASHLSQHTARPTLGNGQHLADVPNRLTSTRRAQKFPREVSFRIEMSRAWSATSLFNRWFSRSSSFRRRA